MASAEFREEGRGQRCCSQLPPAPALSWSGLDHPNWEKTGSGRISSALSWFLAGVEQHSRESLCRAQQQQQPAWFGHACYKKQEYNLISAPCQLSPGRAQPCCCFPGSSIPAGAACPFPWRLPGRSRLPAEGWIDWITKPEERRSCLQQIRPDWTGSEPWARLWSRAEL